MTLRTDAPHVVLHCRDSSLWAIPLTERKSFFDAWTEGKPFWYGVDVWGATIVVKLADITGAIICTPESIALHAAEADELAARSLLDGA